MRLRETLPRDLAASLVVFLVAIPLCLGIAIASGAPVAMGPDRFLDGSIFDPEADNRTSTTFKQQESNHGD